MIKYQRKPVFGVFDDLPKESPKKRMSCISGLSQACKKVFLTTKEMRICGKCMEMINNKNLTSGIRGKQ